MQNAELQLLADIQQDTAKWQILVLVWNNINYPKFSYFSISLKLSIFFLARKP